jgi:16S rRNA (guanine966-N2)-methyltransferase
MTHRNRLRIIGGQWRSRLVRFRDAPGLRPTPDRVRETLFNWLGQDLDGLACIDLFAGSGALGFEALSRGARRVVMVERDRATCRMLHESARALGTEALEIVEGEALSYLGGCTEHFDCAFVDPPYASTLACDAMRRLPPRLNPGARVYVESAKALAPGAAWRAIREGRAGAVRFALYQFDAEAGANPPPLPGSEP